MQKTKNGIIPHCESHWGTQNQMRLENYPQCATQCATQWDSQNHMKRAIGTISQHILEFSLSFPKMCGWLQLHVYICNLF